MNINNIPQLSIKNNHLHMDGRDIVEIAGHYGTPLYIGSEQRIEDNVREVQQAFQKYHANTTVHYAAKAETSLATLEIVHMAGGSLEVNSGGELYKGMRAGFAGKDIIFNGVAKTEKEIESALVNEIKAINVDSPFELERIVETAMACKKQANVLLRIVPDVASGVAKGVETGTHECKFGTMLEDVPAMLHYAKEHEKWVHVRGFHFHIGTQTYHLTSFLESLQVLLEFAANIYKEMQFLPEIIDIGGGLPIPYFIDATASQYMPSSIYQMLRGVLTTDEIAEAVAGKLHAYDGIFKDCELLLEPGRKIVGDAFVMVSRVENKKYRRAMNENWIMLDAGLNVMSEVKNYHWYFPMVCANKITEPHMYPVKIAGPLCESGDVWMDYDGHKDLPDFRMMPESVTVGDYVAMLETGAYGTSMMSRYNGRPMAGVIIIRKDGSLFMAKKPETYEDLLTGEFSIAE